MTNFEPIFAKLFEWKRLGNRKLNDGTNLIGHCPHIAPEAWLHTIYPTLSDAEIAKLENQIGFPVPTEYRNFLGSASNGLKIFGDTLYLFGLQGKIERARTDWRKPYCIVTPNTLERPPDSQDDYFFIGGYSWDGSLVYFDGAGLVHWCSEESCESLKTWGSLFDFLDSEVNRICTLFDSDGRESDPDKPSTPN